MGILDRLLGRKSGGGMPELVKAILDQFGGVDALISKLQQSGISEQLSTWVGHGANAPVSKEQVTDAIGGDAVAGIARRLRIDEDEAGARLANALPKLIDRLTPAGSLPEGGIDERTVNDLLDGILRR